MKQKVYTNDEAIDFVYKMLKEREINPHGRFYNKVWLADRNKDCINVAKPHAKYPYTELLACRTRKYVANVAAKYNCYSIVELSKKV